MVTTYENEWDWGPAGRDKFNHIVGAVCKFTLNITDSPYTGMLKDGIQTGLIRISLLNSGTGANPEYKPNAGLKFLRSGIKSANALLVPQFNGYTNNIFDPDYYHLSNHVLRSATPGTARDAYPEKHWEGFGQEHGPRSPTTIKKLLQGDDCFTMTGLSDMTRYVYERRKSLKYHLFELFVLAFT